jgi:HEAT repeat protein
MTFWKKLFGGGAVSSRPAVPTKQNDFTAGISDPEVRRLTQLLLQQTDKVRTAIELAKLGALAIDALLGVLKHGNNDSRMAAAIALGEIGDSIAVPMLIGALSDSWWDVRSQAARSLGKIGDRTALEALARQLKDEEAGAFASTKHMIGDRVVTDMGDTVKKNLATAIEAISQGNRIPRSFLGQ